jgi:hypothetical protein
MWYLNFVIPGLGTLKSIAIGDYDDPLLQIPFHPF